MRFKIFDLHRKYKQANITLLLLLSGTLALGLVSSSLSSAEIYRYVDEEGVVHLTNIPRDDRYKAELKEGQEKSYLTPIPDNHDPMIWRVSEKYSVAYALVKAIIKAESNFDPKAISRAGARGLMQLMPATATALGVTDSFYPEDNIEGGVRYLLELFNGNLELALAAYNSGEATVSRYNGIPPYRETRTYIQRVLRYFQKYSSERNAGRAKDHYKGEDRIYGAPWGIFCPCSRTRQRILLHESEPQGTRAVV